MEQVSSREQILLELRSEFNLLLTFSDALDAKLNMLIGSGALVLSLFSTLGLVQPGPAWYWVVIIAVSAAYFGSLAFLGYTLAPATYHLPISADWDHIYTTYIDLAGDELLDKLISQNIFVIDEARKINDRKALAVKVGLGALLLVLIVLMVCRLILAGQ